MPRSTASQMAFVCKTTGTQKEGESEETSVSQPAYSVARAYTRSRPAVSFATSDHFLIWWDRERCMNSTLKTLLPETLMQHATIFALPCISGHTTVGTEKSSSILTLFVHNGKACLLCNQSNAIPAQGSFTKHVRKPVMPSPLKARQLAPASVTKVNESYSRTTSSTTFLTWSKQTARPVQHIGQIIKQPHILVSKALRILVH